jgi:hypothetical protein
MRHVTSILLIASGIALAAAHVSAEPVAEPKGRYTMTPVDGGLIRLDTETGAVALCTRKNEAWACEPMKDGSTGAGDRAKLEEENKALKERLKTLEEAKPSTPPADAYPTEPPGGSVSQLPTEEEIDKAFDFAERMYKKLRDRIQKFEQPSPSPAPKTGEGGTGAL